MPRGVNEVISIERTGNGIDPLFSIGLLGDRVPTYKGGGTSGPAHTKYEYYITDKMGGLDYGSSR